MVTGTYKSLMLASDLHSDYTNSIGLLDRANITLHAGVYGIVNNAINLGQWAGFVDENTQEWDLATDFQRDGSQNLADAYTESKAGYDLAGDLVTSLIPGLLATKAITALKATKFGLSTVGFFDGRINKLQDSIKLAYDTEGRAANVGALKFNLFAAKAGQQAIEGTIITAAIEATQNLGETLNDSGMSGMEKLAKISNSLMIGAAGQGVVGGAWGYKVMAGELKSAQQATFNSVEAPFVYRSVSSRVGNIPTQLPIGQRMVHALGEYDRIANLPTPTDLHLRAQATNLASAKLDVDTLVNEMFPNTDKSGAAETMRNFMRSAAATPEGRAQMAGIMGDFKRIDYTNADPLASVDLTKLADGVTLRTVDKATLKSLTEANPKDMLDTKTMKLTMEQGNKVVNTVDDLGDLNSNRELLAHASVFKLLPSERNAVIEEMTAFAIDRAIGSDTSAFSILKQFYKYSKNNAVAKSSKFPALKSYLNSLGDDVSEAVYGSVRRSFLDTSTGKITDAQITHLGDTAGFNYIRSAETITFKRSTAAAANGVEVVSARDIPEALAGDDLVKYQAARVLAASSKDNLNAVVAKTKSLDKLSVADAYRLEAMLTGTRAGETTIKVGGEVFDKSDAVKAVSVVKGSEYERILKANHKLKADDVYNTLGYKDVRGASSILSVKDMPAYAMFEEFIQPASELTKRKVVTLVHESPTFNHAQLSAASYAESVRAETEQTFKACAARILGTSRTGTSATENYFPELNVEAVDGFGDARLLMSTPSIGNYGDLITGAAYVGDQTVKLAEAKFNSVLQVPMTDAANSLMRASADEQAEFLALQAWYAQQSDKFYPVMPNLFVKSELMSSAMASIGKNPGATVEELMRGHRAGVDYAALTKDGAAANYVAKFMELNRNHIAASKRDIQAAYGNLDSFDMEALYLPPPTFKFVAFMAEDATSPLSQTKSTVYRIGAESREALEAKVRAALVDNPSWIRKNPADMKEFAQAQGMWEWSGKDLVTAGAKSGMHRTGGVPDVTAETDLAKVLGDHIAWMKRSNMQIHRSAVELHYSDLISKLNTLSRQAQSGISSELGLKTQKLDDYAQVAQTLLGSDEHGFSTWKLLNNGLEDWTSKALTVVHKATHAVRSSKDKVAAIEEQVKQVDEQLRKFGMKMPIADATSERLAREMNVDPASIRNKVSWLNHWQATFLLRLDATDAFVNTLGTASKIGSEFQFLKTRYEASSPEVKAVFDSEVKALFGAGHGQATTGEMFTYKSMAKAYARALAEYHTDAGKANVDRWTNVEHLMRKDQAIMRNLHEEIKIDEALRTPADLDSWKAKGINALSKGIEFGATPSSYTAAINQYATLHIAESLGKALQLAPAELQMFKFKFFNSVNASYVAAQKPRLFQGAAGIAMSLYQSYMFHTMSNLFRYAEHGSKSAPAMFAALNSTFFGAQSLPGFNFINENVVAAHGNRNTDVYGAAAAALGQSQNRDAADFVMYGAGAFLLQGNMYTRGGLTPRSPILVPSSVQDIPLAQAVMKIGGSVYETASRIVHGAPVASSLWDGLVNLGLNRPLTGLADIARGKSVDGQYNTVMLHEDLWTWASAVRAAGMRPLNEQIGRDYMSRQMAYKSHDAEAKKRLGEEIRVMQTHKPEAMDDPNFVSQLAMRYQKAGGSPDRFDQFLADQLAKGNNDLYTRLEANVRRNSDALSTYRDVFGGYE